MKKFVFVCEVIVRGGKPESAGCEIWAGNAKAAERAFKGVVCNLKNCTEKQIKNLRRI